MAGRAAGSSRTRFLIAAAVLGAVVACQPAANAWTVGGWVFPTPQPVPSGATAVPLDVQAIPSSVEAGLDGWACPAALARATLTYRPGETPPVAYIDEGPTGDPIEVHWRWPWGFSARDVDGRLEIVDPSGAVFAREGDRMTVGGGWLADDVAFVVCVGEFVPHRA